MLLYSSNIASESKYSLGTYDVHEIPYAVRLKTLDVYSYNFRQVESTF